MFLAGLALAAGVSVAAAVTWWAGLPFVLACLVLLIVGGNARARKPAKGVVWLMPPYGDDAFDEAQESDEDEEIASAALAPFVQIGKGLFSPEPGSSPE